MSLNPGDYADVDLGTFGTVIQEDFNKMLFNGFIPSVNYRSVWTNFLLNYKGVYKKDLPKAAGDRGKEFEKNLAPLISYGVSRSVNIKTDSRAFIRTKPEGQEKLKIGKALFGIRDGIPQASTDVTLARIIALFPVLVARLMIAYPNVVKTVGKVPAGLPKYLAFSAGASLISTEKKGDKMFALWKEWQTAQDAIINKKNPTDAEKLALYADAVRNSQWIPEGERDAIRVKLDAVETVEFVFEAGANETAADIAKELMAADITKLKKAEPKHKSSSGSGSGEAKIPRADKAEQLKEYQAKLGEISVYLGTAGFKSTEKGANIPVSTLKEMLVDEKEKKLWVDDGKGKLVGKVLKKQDLIDMSTLDPTLALLFQEAESLAEGLY